MSILEALLSRPAKAATGSGVAMMTQGIPMSSIFGNDPYRNAIGAVGVWRNNLWVRAAERAISTRLSTVPWWLLDGEGDHVTAESPEAERAVWELFERPYRPRPGDPVTATPTTWRALLSITSRHMGVCGTGFWYLDQTEALAGTPMDILYVHPARMTPAENKGGALIGWVLDGHTQHPTALEVDAVVPFYLEPPDEGFLADGLVASALSKVEMTKLSDRHANFTLGTGGRMPGIYRPMNGGTIPEEKFNALQRDIRNVNEMPDASKRSLVLQGPIEFQATSATNDAMGLVELANLSRDDILGLWGVPKTQLGMDVPAGLNSGATKSLDEAVLWQGAIMPRLRTIVETVDTRILSRYDGLGMILSLGVQTPTFDDAMPLYDMAAKAAGQPLRNVERRAIIGLPPLGDSRDDEVWLPINLVPAFQAEAFDPEAVKAKTPRQLATLRTELAAFLKEQTERVARKIEEKSAAVERKPNDTSPWWNEKAEDEALLKVLRPILADTAMASARSARSRVTGKADVIPWDEAMMTKALARVGNRIKLINASTRQRIKELVTEGLRVGMSPASLALAMRDELSPDRLPPLPDDVRAWEPVLRGARASFASELRAETIARTEMRVAQNAATIDSYQDLGVEKLVAIDGDEDDLCRGRDGQEVTYEQAEEWAASEHPNGTLDFRPLISFGGKQDFAGKAEPMTYQPSPQPVINVGQPEVTVNVSMPPIVMPDSFTVDVPAPVIHVAAPEVHMAPAPAVNVAAPVVNVAPPVVNVAPPSVTVEAQKASTDGIQMMYITNMPGPKRHIVKRDPRTQAITSVEDVEA